jgi:hypothetical protein
MRDMSLRAKQPSLRATQTLMRAMQRYVKGMRSSTLTLTLVNGDTDEHTPRMPDTGLPKSPNALHTTQPAEHLIHSHTGRHPRMPARTARCRPARSCSGCCGTPCGGGPSLAVLLQDALGRARASLAVLSCAPAGRWGEPEPASLCSACNKAYRGRRACQVSSRACVRRPVERVGDVGRAEYAHALLYCSQSSRDTNHRARAQRAGLKRQLAVPVNKQAHVSKPSVFCP